MLPPDARRIIKENKKYTDMLAKYDETGVFPLDKVRKSFTLKQATVSKLKKLSEQTGRSMSSIIESLVANR